MDIDVIYAVWLREIKNFLRARERFIISLVVPFFWFLVLGTGLASSVQFKGLNLDYSTFLAPGIIALPIIGSVYWAVSIIWDRKLGFLKEMLVAPVSRLSIALGKSFGGASVAIIQSILILALFMLLGIKVHISLLLLLPLMFIVALSFVNMGIIIACLLETVEGFELVMGVMVTPMYFLSGAFFPIVNFPVWMRLLAQINPMTYGVELFRYIIAGSSTIPIFVSLPFVLIFFVVSSVVSSYIFSKTQ